MNDLTLVVMAAGMGSRFDGLKQITPVDEDGNFLIDYSIYDAIKAGFKKIVFIIKEENLIEFKETIGKRIEDKIDIQYAFQKLEDVLKFVNVPESRIKPWGTTHAILAAQKYINGPFAVINADDFYGADAFMVVANFLRDESNKNYHIAIAYPFFKVDSKYGFVKRGVLYLENNNVFDIVECSVGYENNLVIAKPLDGTIEFEIKKDHPVSMNMFGFQQNILSDLEIYFEQFMKDNLNNLENCECLLTDFLRNQILTKKIILKYQLSQGEWLGMTFKEDLDKVKEKINELKDKGEYDIHLW